MRDVRRPEASETWVRELEAARLDVQIESPRGQSFLLGRWPRAKISFHAPRAWTALRRRDVLCLAEAYLAGEIDIDGDLAEVVKATRVLGSGGAGLRAWVVAAKRTLPVIGGWNRRSVAFHYDRESAFFLPWLGRWRSYSHGFYAGDDDGLDAAQARKLAHALDALQVEPGSRVLDVGCGWGSFLEYAGLRGVAVHGITLSREQHAFVTELIQKQDLPCSVEFVDFFDLRSASRYDGAVLMGSLEHLGRYRRVARRLRSLIAPGGRIYADFCAHRDDGRPSRFVSRHAWPGPTTYVRPGRLERALQVSGFRIESRSDDTASYARSTRDWADALEKEREALAAAFGEREVRTFLLLLRASQEYFETGRMQAHHLVARIAGSQRRLGAGRGPRAAPRS